MKLVRNPDGLAAEVVHHGFHVAHFFAWGEDFEAFAGGAPLDDVDIDPAHAPCAYDASVALEEVDSLGADKG